MPKGWGPSPLIRTTCLVLLTLGSMGAQQSAQFVSQAAATQRLEFDVFLPLENTDQLDRLLAAQHTPGSPSYHKWLTPDQFRSQFGPNPAALEKAQSELALRGLAVTATTGHGLHVTGNAGAVQRAFRVTLWNARTPSGAQRLMTNQTVTMPAALRQLGAVVPAFSPLRPHHVHSRKNGQATDNRYSNVGPYWFTDIKQAYNFPSFQALTGKGRTIAIVISSDVLDSDLQLYFGHENLKHPKIERHPILGGPAPFDPNSGDSDEASLDVQQSGGMAPGATIALYDMPDLSDTSILAAYQTIVDENKADIVSSSFGGAELYYTPAYNKGVDFRFLLHIYHEIFKQGNAQGITFVASSGDNGGLEAVSLNGTKFVPSVSSPASDPNVTAVGGTNLLTTYTAGSLDSKYVRENAYHDRMDPAQGALPNEIWGAGGGKSAVFGKPDYQYVVNTGSATRAVPDISLQMGGCPAGALLPCPPDRSSVVTAIGGTFYLLIGTSVSAPEFAGLLALEEEKSGERLGNVNYQIYLQSAAQQRHEGSFFHQGIPGNNGVFNSSVGKSGYNMVVGNGTPIGVNFIMAPYTPVAGTPTTPSNP
jgi:kumamolisin